MESNPTELVSFGDLRCHLVTARTRSDEIVRVHLIFVIYLFLLLAVMCVFLRSFSTEIEKGDEKIQAINNSLWERKKHVSHSN